MILKDEFLAVFGEVCRDDFYGLHSLPFTPDVILDIGANVGAFTSFARYLFPRARIVAIEPDPRTRVILQKYTSHLPGITYVPKALGTGEIWQGIPPLKTPYFGAVHSYVTAGQLGFPSTEIGKPPGEDGRDGLPAYTRSIVDSVSLDELVADFVLPDDLLLIKMDCEGGENCMFAHEPSMTAIRRADAITMETHYYTKGTGTEYQANSVAVVEGLMSLSNTHRCGLNEATRHFKAIRKTIYA